MRGEFLRERAEKFLDTAIMIYEKGYYDLSAFALEQSCQLFLKYTLWKKLGDYPKTHSLINLLEELKEGIPEKHSIIGDFINENRDIINALEMAYLESRYFPGIFFKEQIEKMINFVVKFKEFLKSV